MKTPIIPSVIFSMSLAGMTFGQQEPVWQAKLIQRNIEVSGTFQSSIDLKGNQVSKAPIPKGGSEFTLWAFQQAADGSIQEELIDTEIVGSYLPEGTLTITTPDPYRAGIPRTRIDQGFTVTYDVGGLQSDLSAPEAARKVLLDHKLNLTEGDPITGTPGPDLDFKQVFISENGASDLVFNQTNLPYTDSYNDSGIETFTLLALPDGDVARIQLDQAQVQIWPLADVSFSGIPQGGAVKIVPDVLINLENLYPTSDTWVQFYYGPHEPGTIGTRINGASVQLVDNAVPDNRVIKLTTLDNLLLQDGVWTLEVLTQTPFGTESLGSAPISIDRNLVLNGSLRYLSDN